MDWYTRHIMASTSGGSRIMYHIGHGFPHPQPGKKNSPDGISWNRGFRKFRREEKVVFLTPDFARVWNNHGKNGNVYVFEVPQWVIQESGGVNEYDYASELIIPEYLWKYVVFKGRIDQGRASEIAEQRAHATPTKNVKVEVPPVILGSIVRWMKSVERGYKRESVFRVVDIKKDRANIVYLGELSWSWEFDKSSKKHKQKKKIRKPWDFKGRGVEEAFLPHLTVDREAEEFLK